MRCDHCSSTNMTAIKFRLDGGTVLELLTCHFCEWRRWSKEQEYIPLAKVLQLTAAQRPR